MTKDKGTVFIAVDNVLHEVCVSAQTATRSIDDLRLTLRQIREKIKPVHRRYRPGTRRGKDKSLERTYIVTTGRP